MMENLVYLAYPLAYLLGSIPTAIWVSRALQLEDPTTQGSNNPGATNMLRISGKKPAIMTLLGDFFKGSVAIWVGMLLHFSQFELLLLMLCCLLGHMYPLFNRFVGGKGVATFFGCMALIDLIVGGLVALLWFCLAKLLKISSLSAIVSISVAPIIAWVMGWEVVSIMVFLSICLLILWRHRANIERLLKRTES